MQFTEKQLQDFKILYKKNTWEEISNEEATEHALKLIYLLKPILIPLMEEFLNDPDSWI